MFVSVFKSLQLLNQAKHWTRIDAENADSADPHLNHPRSSALVRVPPNSLELIFIKIIRVHQRSSASHPTP
jgi:hypothetical protein